MMTTRRAQPGFRLDKVHQGLHHGWHCKDDLDYESQDGDVYEAEFQDEVDGWRGDFQWHATDETEVNKIYRTSTGRLRTITSYEDDYGDLYIGQRVCMYGRVTHNHCSEIYGLSVGAPFERGRIAMKTREARGGDSGGPWYYRKTAYGVHEGWTWLFGSRDKWTAVAWLDDALDVTVLTS